MGVPLVAFALKDSSKHTVFEISENLRRFGWIVPAYTMPADAQHVAVLRVVVREDFGRSLAERLVSHIELVVKELELLPSRTAIGSAHVDAVQEENKDPKSGKKTQREIIEDATRTWRRFVNSKKTGVC